MNEPQKQLVIAKKMKNQDICDTLWKYVEDWVPNVANEEMNVK